MSNASVLEWNKSELLRFIDSIKRLSTRDRRYFLDQLYIHGFIDILGFPVDLRKAIDGNPNRNYGRKLKYYPEDNPSKRY